MILCVSYHRQRHIQSIILISYVTIPYTSAEALTCCKLSKSNVPLTQQTSIVKTKASTCKNQN